MLQAFSELSIKFEQEKERLKRVLEVSFGGREDEGCRCWKWNATENNTKLIVWSRHLRATMMHC
jgi:hypothetical protein